MAETFLTEAATASTFSLDVWVEFYVRSGQGVHWDRYNSTF